VFFFSFIHLLSSCGLSTHNKHDDDDDSIYCESVHYGYHYHFLMLLLAVTLTVVTGNLSVVSVLSFSLLAQSFIPLIVVLCFNCNVNEGVDAC